MGSVGENIEKTQRMNVDSVCIIGAGPSGLAAGKYLLAEKAFSRIVVFEQRSKVGGLWNYVPCPSAAVEEFPIPQTDPHAGVDEPIPNHGDDSGAADSKAHDDLEFMSPIYDRLETNIPRGLMGFSDLDWPDECQLFPKHQTVLEYIERYSEAVKHLIRFKTQVLDVALNEDERWVVKTQTITPKERGEVQEQIFDAVLVANGHFNVPFIPAVPGIKAWNKLYPGSIVHSQLYRNPENYLDKKTIIVGNSASGVDIGAQVARTCKLPLIQSQKSESYFQQSSSTARLEKPEIVEYVAKDRAVRFKDGSVISNIDAIIYCTGYFYSFPFLTSLRPPVVNTGEHVENTYKHIFYSPRPTLAFAVLNQKIIPFPVAEAQSAVIARVWSGRLNLPKATDMEEWERENRKEAEDEKEFHVLKFPKDADYINEMHTLCAESAPHARHPHTDATDGIGGVVGKEPPYWDEKEYWTRERFPAIKKAFQSFGEERHSKRTLESVGFDFEARKQQDKEEGAA